MLSCYFGPALHKCSRTFFCPKTSATIHHKIECDVRGKVPMIFIAWVGPLINQWPLKLYIPTMAISFIHLHVLIYVDTIQTIGYIGLRYIFLMMGETWVMIFILSALGTLFQRKAFKRQHSLFQLPSMIDSLVSRWILFLDTHVSRLETRRTSIYAALCAGVLAGAARLYMHMFQQGEWNTSIEESFAVMLIVMSLGLFLGDKLT